MKEFKLRAWGHQDEADYRMFYSFSMIDHLFIPWHNEIPICDHTFMQYTGIDDMDGVKIYEGDILEFADKWEWYRGKYAAKFMGREGKHLKEIQAKFDAEPMERREITMPECYEWLLSSEIQNYWHVIGNIHENPELLESK